MPLFLISMLPRLTEITEAKTFYVGVQGLFGCLPWGMLLTFLNDYLSQNKGLSVPVATVVSRHLGSGPYLWACAAPACNKCWSPLMWSSLSLLAMLPRASQ